MKNLTQEMNGIHLRNCFVLSLMKLIVMNYFDNFERNFT